MPELDGFSAIDPSAGETSPETLKLAKKEESALADGPQKVRNEVHAIAVRALRFGATVLAAIVVVRVWHLAGPESCRWLGDNELQSIDKMLFSSAFGGLVFGYLKEIMHPLQK